MSFSKQFKPTKTSNDNQKSSPILDKEDSKRLKTFKDYKGPLLKGTRKEDFSYQDEVILHSPKISDFNQDEQLPLPEELATIIQNL